MAYTPISPFRRAMNAAMLQREAAMAEPPALSVVDKWQVLRELSEAGARLGVSHRHMHVLQALLSFHKGNTIDISGAAPVVFASNASICERLGGMPCSTMRRHVVALVDAGFLIRRDSPNGKRYMRRYGDHQVAYGFDLSPLARRFPEILEAADAARAEHARIREIRHDISLIRRDLLAFAEMRGMPSHGDLFEICASAAKALRRKLSLQALDDLLTTIKQAASILLPRSIETSDLSTNAARIEQHHQRSDEDHYYDKDTSEGSNTAETPSSPEQIDLTEVLTTCPEVCAYSPSPPATWSAFEALMHQLAPMLGIEQRLWQRANEAMGRRTASIVIASILQRQTTIRVPGAYLRKLISCSEVGKLSLSAVFRAIKPPESPRVHNCELTS